MYKNSVSLMKYVTILTWAFFMFATAQASDVENTQDTNVITSVKLRPVGGTVSIGGTVKPAKSVTLAAQIPGRIDKIAGEEGDAFAAGAVLLTIDDEDLRAKREAAAAQWNSAAAALRNANMQYSRQIVSPGASRQTPGGMGMPGMFDEMFTNPMSSMMGTRDTGFERHADIYSHGVQIEQAQSSLAQAKAQIRQIDSKLRDAKSIAPFEGVIVKKLVEPGDTVQPGQPLLEFADMSEQEIIADVPARLSQSLTIGDEVPATIDTLEGQRINVQVANIFPMADMLRHTIRVKFALPRNMDVAAGIYAEVQLQDPASNDMNLPVVPASSILWRGGLPMVYVVSPTNKINLRMIRVGETLANGDVVILSGLSADDRILDKPAAGISSGQQL